MKVMKVRLKEFVEMLSDLYDNGADYVDIVGMKDNAQDTIILEVRDEYMRSLVLTDDIFNQLMYG